MVEYSVYFIISSSRSNIGATNFFFAVKIEIIEMKLTFSSFFIFIFI